MQASSRFAIPHSIVLEVLSTSSRGAKNKIGRHILGMYLVAISFKAVIYITNYGLAIDMGGDRHNTKKEASAPILFCNSAFI